MNAPWGDGIRSFARDLAEKGYVALIPDYFERTNTIADLIAPLQAFPASRDLWLETLGDAMSYATGRSDIYSSRMGLVGFSMGAHLALRTAKSNAVPKAKLVVDFFGPITVPPFNGIGSDINKLPPTQIHHGDEDVPVPREQSLELEQLLLRAGKRKNVNYEIYFYPEEDHGFHGLRGAAADLSTGRTLEFFDKHLK